MGHDKKSFKKTRIKTLIVFAVGAIVLGGGAWLSRMFLNDVVVGEGLLYRNLFVLFISWFLIMLPITIFAFYVTRPNAMETAVDSVHEVKVQAKAISKATKAHGSAAIMSTNYYISFEFNNRRANFEVDVTQYNTILENEIGTLTYKEDGEEFIFVDFKRN